MKMAADTTLSAEDRAYRLEEVLKDEETRIHEVEKELNRLREKQVCGFRYCFFNEVLSNKRRVKWGDRPHLLAMETKTFFQTM